jgi:hypothetical protein
MRATILAGLSLIDSTGLAILSVTVGTLLLAILTTLWLRGRYRALERDLHGPGGSEGSFTHAVLRNIVRSAKEAVASSSEANTQAIIEERFQADLRAMLLGERFVRAATGLVIILGLLGTFYGLTLSIGRIVQLVSSDSAAVADITQGVSQGLSRALSGMAVAFSNSLVGVLSAVLLTVVGVLSNVSDRRTEVMVQIETYLDRILARAPRAGAPAAAGAPATPTSLGESVARLDGAVSRFEFALQAFATSTRDFREFNAHLKDNVQRLSLAFGDLSETLKAHTNALRGGPRG